MERGQLSMARSFWAIPLLPGTARVQGSLFAMKFFLRLRASKVGKDVGNAMKMGDPDLAQQGRKVLHRPASTMKQLYSRIARWFTMIVALETSSSFGLLQYLQSLEVLRVVSSQITHHWHGGICADLMDEEIAVTSMVCLCFSIKFEVHVVMLS